MLKCPPSAPPSGEKRKWLRNSLQGSYDRPPPGKKARPDVKPPLNDLTSILKTIVEDFQSHSSVCNLIWFSSLQFQYYSIDSIGKEPINASSLLDHPALARPFRFPDIPPSFFEPDHRKRIQNDFERIEVLRREILSQAEKSKKDTPPPIATCLPYPEMMFLYYPFYHYALLRSYASRCYERTEESDEFLRAKQAARRLFLHSRTTKFSNGSHDHYIDNFRKILVDIIPNDDAHSWFTEAMAPGGRKRFLVYRCHKNNSPLVLATIMIDDDDDDDGYEERTLFSELKRKFLYTTMEHPTPRPCSPVLVVQYMPDAYFLVGGAVYMREPRSDNLIAQRLPGQVDMTEDAGYNLHEATYTLWTLSRCVDVLEKESTMLTCMATHPSSKQVPFIGLEGGGITVTESPWPGIIYRVKLDSTKPIGRPGVDEKNNLATLKKQGLLKKPLNTSYVLKLTYPREFRTYGAPVHRLLARHGFAPELYLEFSPPFDLSHYGLENNSNSSFFLPFLRYHLMEDFSPPTDRDPGWMSLAQLAEDATADATLYKAGIQRSLEHILELLRTNGMVHGDMRPNNIMIRVQVRNGARRPEFRADLNLIDIRIIDFDWAGEAGKVFYPAVRNSEIEYWPGQDGGQILAYHDEEMVRAWMKIWPE